MKRPGSGEKPIESRVREYVDFGKKHKFAATLIAMWLVVPPVWSVVATVHGWHVHSLESTISEQRQQIGSKNTEIQRLETLLTPFRTIALEKFTGSDQEALRKLADYVVEQGKKLDKMGSELDKAKAQSGPPKLTPYSKVVTRTADGGYSVLLQFQLSGGGGRVDGYSFSAHILGGAARITAFKGSLKTHAIVGGRETISKDGRTADCFFNPIAAGYPALQIDVTAGCFFELSGSHLEHSCTVNTD